MFLIRVCKNKFKSDLDNQSPLIFNVIKACIKFGLTFFFISLAILKCFFTGLFIFFSYFLYQNCNFLTFFQFHIALFQFFFAIPPHKVALINIFLVRSVFEIIILTKFKTMVKWFFFAFIAAHCNTLINILDFLLLFIFNNY